MKIIQTFWTGNKIATENPLDFKAGWPACEYHWLSWALSCYQARSFFDEVELITDDLGKEILIDTFNLPYTKVSTTLQGKLTQYPNELWALAKLYSYSIQEQPFLHLDGDVYLWKKPTEDILAANIVAQNLEQDLPFYRNTLDEINLQFSVLPLIYTKAYYSDNTIYSANAGVIGGHDLDFFRTYCTEAFLFVDNNLDNIKKVDLRNLPNLNFVYEQYSLYQLALLMHKKINFYMEDVVTTPVYENFIRFQDRPHIKLVHPVAGFKMQTHLCDHLVNTLRLLFPETYYRIFEVLKSEKILLKNKVYDSGLFKAFKFSHPANTQDSELNISATFFVRTIEAFKFFKASDGFDLKMIFNLSTQQFELLLQKLLLSEKEKEIVREIFQLDLLKFELFNKMFNDETSLNSAYKKDKLNYAKFQEEFSLPHSKLLESTILLNNQVEFIELGWPWQFQDISQFKSLLADNSQLEKSSYEIALIPNSIRLQTEEYYLDQMDLLIIDIAKRFNKIADILIEVETYFEPSEVEANPLQFEKLVIDSLKRLCYAGILSMPIAD